MSNENIINIVDENITIELNEQGPQGATGPQGPQGPQGVKGEQGIQGPAGPSNNLTIGTVEIGSSASATITGDSPNQVLNLVLPKGDKGDRGIQGEQGIQGPQGPQGHRGNTGEVGPQGIQGIQGPQGLQGVSVSNVYLLSTIGLVKTYRMELSDGRHFDFQASDGQEGPQGPQGVKGDQGTQGPEGPRGIQGNGVQQVYLLSSSGVYDTYRMLFTNGTYFDYIVTNGTSIGSSWGSISGDIDNQLDLKNKFDSIEEQISEIELYKFPNATIVGSPTIQSGQVSGFSNSNYMIFPFVVDVKNKNFEINFCFTTGSDVTTQQNILDSSYGLALAVKDGHGLMAMSSTGSGFDIGQVVGTYTIQANKTYYAKLTWDGSVYKTAISIDGTGYTDDMSITSSLGLYPTTIYIGSASYDALGRNPNTFNGSINMNKCNLKISNLEVWQGMDEVGLATRADVSLSNLDKIGESKINKDWKYAKSIEQKYEIYNEEEGFDLLSTQKRSTFDRSKFTVAGTPTITDDGVASGFSNSNYLTINNLGDVTNKPFKFYFNFTKLNTLNAMYVVGYENSMCYVFANNNGIQPSIYLNDNESAKAINIGTIALGDSLKIGQNIELCLEWNGVDTYKFTRLDNNVSVQVNSTLKPYRNSQRVGNHNNCKDISIDLKRVRTVVDGKEVFRGNKTGIDQIKKDDYTVVGNPTITDGGVASGFSNSNYIKNFSENAINNTIKIVTNIKPKYLQDSHWQYLFALWNSNYRVISLAFAGSGERYAFAHISDGVSTESFDFINTTGAIEDENISIVVEYSNTTKLLKVQIGDYYASKQMSLQISTFNNIYIGNYADNLGDFFNGQIDLNSFKIYIDDQLVYQPTLRIPYTQSKTGNKIVDANYRDRVQQMYDEFGYTHYYTLGDEPEKYNVSKVGSPTLSGGVASGFGRGNYLRTPIINLSNANNWEVLSPYFSLSSLEGNQSIINADYSYWQGAVLYTFLTRGKIEQRLGFSGWSDYLAPSDFTVEINKQYQTKVRFTGTQYQFYYREAGQQWVQLSVFDRTNKIPLNNIMGIGASQDGDTPCTNGSVDLKQFSITVDGVEVFRCYEPTIPNAYTLQTVQNETIIDSGSNYEQRADLTLKQWGSCTSGSVVNLLPYKDTNYAVTSPYSSKATNSFTPSITGDYIAEGKVVL